MEKRQQALRSWVAETLNLTQINLEIVSGDASFRHYYRVNTEAGPLIVMDAPPDKEDSTSFVTISTAWRKNGVPTPEIKAVDFAQGFMLLSDMGDTQLFSKMLSVDSADNYYAKAMKVLLLIQDLDTAKSSETTLSLDAPPTATLPLYDSRLLQTEMALFREWLLGKKLKLKLSKDEEQTLTQSFTLLEENALQQQQVTVHRDFHSRNLMVLEDDSLGVLDFQDAVIGPITYDLVSLLRDCYLIWPDDKVTQWCHDYHKLLVSRKIIQLDFTTFKKHFDLMGIQRHLKAAGIFARLSMRDGKHTYLNDIPRTVNYILQVSERYSQLQPLHHFILTRVTPALKHLDIVQ